MAKKIFIVAGEPSGDLHASKLAKEMKSLDPEVRLMGVGGSNMMAAGVQIFARTDELAIIGVLDIFRHLKKLKDIFLLILTKVDEERPDSVVLVDYPGFNLKLVKHLKKRNLRVIYYISPQIWAWGKNRIKIIKKYVDKILVLFMFEAVIYRQHRIPVEFVGHPLLDSAKSSLDKPILRERFHLDTLKKTIIILPGSRSREVNMLLPVMIAGLKLIYEKIKDIQVIFVKSHNIENGVFEKYIGGMSISYQIVENRKNELYDYLSVSDLAFVASGTATLECAIMNVPMIILYKLSLINALYMKPFIRVRHIGLVNILADREIVPELIQFDATPLKLFNKAYQILTDNKKTDEIKRNLSSVTKSLGSPGASRRAAQAILN